MKSIGHEINLEFENLQISDNNLFNYLKDYECLYVDSGRTGIHLLSQLFANQEVLVPCFSCAGVIRQFRQDVDLVYYDLTSDFVIDVEDLKSKITERTGGIYITHYWGRQQPKTVLEELAKLKEEYGLCVIEDTTHSIYTRPHSIGDYCVCSTRKWFSVPDGGVVYAPKLDLSRIDITGLKPGGTPEKVYYQSLKTLYLRGEADERNLLDEKFLAIESTINHHDCPNDGYLMSDLTRFLASCCDIKKAREKRRENFAFLLNRIKSPYLTPAFTGLEEGEYPFYAVFYAKHRDAFRAYMMRHDVYISLLWPTHTYEELADQPTAKRMGEEIFNIPIDQRYGREEMAYVADLINGFRP